MRSHEKDFKQWEEENKQLLDYKEQLKKKKEIRDFPFEKDFRELPAIRQYSRRTIKSYTQKPCGQRMRFENKHKVLVS